jgi:hypothetical protein
MIILPRSNAPLAGVRLSIGLWTPITKNLGTDNPRDTRLRSGKDMMWVPGNTSPLKKTGTATVTKPIAPCVRTAGNGNI